MYRKSKKIDIKFNNTFFVFTKVLEAQVNLVNGWHRKKI